MEGTTGVGDEDLLGALEIHWQPIVALPARRCVGAEALARLPGRRPVGALLRDADARGIARFEHAAVECAFAASAALPEDVFVSVNASARLLAAWRDGVDWPTPPPDRTIVVELTEVAPVVAYDDLRRLVDELRHDGVRFAIDDVGAGFNSLRHVLELDPDIVKLDASLISGLASDSARRTLLRTLAAFAADTGAALVAEGVETEAQAGAIAEAGVAYAQGYLFGHPTRLSSGSDGRAGPAALRRPRRDPADPGGLRRR